MYIIPAFAFFLVICSGSHPRISQPNARKARWLHPWSTAMFHFMFIQCKCCQERTDRGMLEFSTLRVIDYLLSSISKTYWAIEYKRLTKTNYKFNFFYNFLSHSLSYSSNLYNGSVNKILHTLMSSCSLHVRIYQKVSDTMVTRYSPAENFSSCWCIKKTWFSILLENLYFKHITIIYAKKFLFCVEEGVVSLGEMGITFRGW